MANTKTTATPNKRAAKTTPKPKTSKTSKPKQTGKPKPKTTAKPKTAKRTVSERRPEYAEAEKIATALVTVDSSGKTIKRAPIGTPKMARVSAEIVGKRKPADVIRLAMFGGPKFKREESATAALKIARDYAGAKIGQTDLPDGARARLSALALQLGPPTVHKLNGRALCAALVGLSDKPAKSNRK